VFSVGIAGTKGYKTRGVAICAAKEETMKRGLMGTLAAVALVAGGLGVAVAGSSRLWARASGIGQAAAKPAGEAQGRASDLAASVQIEPEDLGKLLQATKGNKPLVLHIGFKNFYEQARIPGSEYAGPGRTPEGLDLLRKRVASLPRKQFIVLYCGCCPWDKCPNAKPAYDALQAMGFTNVKVVHVAENFGANWVNAGLPVTKGE